MSTFPGGFVPVAPPADGLRLAFAAARRRRNRKAGATGTAGLLAVVALFASTGGTGQRALMQEPLPPSSTTGLGIVEGAGDPTAAPDDDTTTPATSITDATTSMKRTTSTSQRVAGTTQTQGGDETTGSAAGSGVRAQGTKAVSGPMTRSTSIFYTGDLMCPARKQQERQRGLCTEVYASSNSDKTMSITAQICNVGTVTEMLSFATARELDVAVRHAGLDVWRWSLGRHFAATPHEIMVGTQECVVWTTQWALVDSHGAKVPAGTYAVVADFDADEVAGPDRHPTYPITVSQQP
jgi:hypothetical protein